MNKKQVDALLEIFAEKLKEPRNSEIRVALRRILDNADLQDLRDVMHLSGYKSVDYSFIQEDILRTQLEVDNLRMEDAACSTQIKEEERFFVFCINAFYQIENLTNYYFVKIFPDFEELLSYIEQHSNYRHKVDKDTGGHKERGVGDIDISCKIYALANELFPSSQEQPDFTYKTICGLRTVRNEGFHRCQIEETEPKKTLEDFYRYNDYSTIRELLRKYTNTIRKKIEAKQAIVSSYQERYTMIAGTLHPVSDEILSQAKYAKITCFNNPGAEKKENWAIGITLESGKKSFINVHKTYFVERYNLKKNEDVTSLLPRLRFYQAIPKDMMDVYEEDNKEETINPFDKEVIKKYHIVEALDIK